MAALPVLPLFSFFCPVLRSLYWARPILMYVFDFLFLFIVLGASIGRYRRREGYRLRRNSVQLVEMGDAGGAVNIILERGWVKKERVGNRTDLAECIREKRGTRGEGGPREAFGASHVLQEILTIKSDDVVGRSKAYEAIVKGDPMPTPGIPESLNVLLHELRGLGLSIKLD